MTSQEAEFGVVAEDAPLAPGDILGLRVWQVVLRERTWTADAVGNVEQVSGRQMALRSIYKDYHWEPGENVARCWPGQVGFAAGVNGTRPPNPIKVKTQECLRTHDHNVVSPVQDKCYRLHYDDERVDPGHSCGFYAYHNDEPNRHCGGANMTVEGVVQGYGVTTIGSKGFRCSKARILALIIPKPTPKMSDRMRANYRNVDWERLAAHHGAALFDTRDDAVAAFPLGRRNSRLTLPEPREDS